MIDILAFRLRYGRQTVAFPDGAPKFPARFRGRPVVDAARCGDGCDACADACPTEAILDPGKPTMRIDLGRCVFCGTCATACPPGTIRFTDDHRLAARTRDDLVVSRDEPILAAALKKEMLRLFGRSLKLRQVSAGGCNGCEAELNATGNIQFDAGRFGIQFVASPRHADGIVVTGPVSDNMRVALLKTYEAVPAPKLVISVGACAISGGVFRGSPVVAGGAEAALGGIPVDLHVPGCPPHPITFLDGVLRLLGRVR
jgi:Ni,Fe-hydrogenase III small subunit/formate hydrogenlyase subunit 6/NADH:ubiquinone oxidoreductase subunit I